jgi:starch synthase
LNKICTTPVENPVLVNPGMKRVWLVAAENDTLPEGKVGGIADVVRDLPIALAGLGLDVSVIVPSYGVLHKVPGASFFRKVRARFARRSYVASVYTVAVADSPVKQFVIEHPLLSPLGPGQIYINDDPGLPFETDASKFAFFSAVVAAWVNDSESPPDVLHLNDWHTGLIPALQRFGSPDAQLNKVRIVFTIHNLAYQGVRPLRNSDSSLEAWFPGLLQFETQLRDTKYKNCFNFMASAIRLADRVNTVSPSYAMEVQRSSDPLTGFRGGEGLEVELCKAFSEGRLTGILNGCMYPEKSEPPTDWIELLRLIAKRAVNINASQPAVDWIQKQKRNQPRHLLLSISRITDQKVALFLEPAGGHPTALEAILTAAGPESLFIMAGTGDRNLESRFAEIAHSYNNFLYLRCYVDGLTEQLYSIADLFLMPSSFEPCGISQMLAMRAGHPCVVHAVGGLKDTVKDGVTGFVFDGETPAEQAENFVKCVGNAITIKLKDPSKWRKICKNAALQRFSWTEAATTYRDKLYQHG